MSQKCSAILIHKDGASIMRAPRSPRINTSVNQNKFIIFQKLEIEFIINIREYKIVVFLNIEINQRLTRPPFSADQVALLEFHYH